MFSFVGAAVPHESSTGNSLLMWEALSQRRPGSSYHGCNIAAWSAPPTLSSTVTSHSGMKISFVVVLALPSKNAEAKKEHEDD
jgi:hypothetical protein